MTNGPFSRRVSVSVKDRNGDPVLGANIVWYVNGAEAGTARATDGASSFEVADPKAAISVSAGVGEQTFGPVRLADDQQYYEFRLDIELHPKPREFLMRHFPAMVGIFFILLAVVLVFAFRDPSPVQVRVLLAVLALGAGGFAGEFAGFLKADLTLGKKLVISAGGAMAVFVLLYFFVPAGTPRTASPSSSAPRAAPSVPDTTRAR